MQQLAGSAMISPELCEYLRRCGLSEKKVAESGPETELLKNLGVYGDIAEAYMETLEKEFNVDMSQFEFENYFPPEFAGGSTIERLLYWIVPPLARKQRRAEDFRPVTLRMIDEAIRERRWAN